MIDWLGVLFNSAWILGLSLLLAGFSHHHWLASLENRVLREQLAQPSFRKLFWISLFLVGIGLAGTSQRLWESGIWIIFLLISAVNAITIHRGK
jgi:hypothetical protein